MTAIAVDAVAPAPKPEPARDRYGRYLLPTVDRKKVAPYTRATTIAKTLADNYQLEQWKMRMVAKGLAGRQDLIGMAAAHDPDIDRSIFAEIVDAAMEAAESASGRRDGTTLHRFTELVDLGQRQADDIPEPYRARVLGYQAELARNGVQIHPEWVEQIFVDDRYTIAGTADRIVTLADGRRVIADLKTGKEVRFGALEFAIQLAIYANHTATATFGPTGEAKRGDRVDVDRETGLIIHLPSKGEGCHLHLVDLAQGYAALQTAMEVREWRSTKGLLSAYTVVNGGTGGAQAVRDWLRDRVKAVAAHEAALAELVRRWPTTVPQPLPAELAAYQIEDLAAALDRVEQAHEIPFGPPRPGLVTPKPTRKTSPR